MRATNITAFYCLCFNKKMIENFRQNFMNCFWKSTADSPKFALRLLVNLSAFVLFQSRFLECYDAKAESI
jgi:hypothetical protein